MTRARALVAGAALVVLAALGLAPAAGRADPAPSSGGAAAPIQVVGAAGRGVEDAVLVGARGEIYGREAAPGGGERRWRRRSGGGTAALLLTAGGPSADEIWAMGAAAPPYRHDGRTWHAVPAGQGARGEALLAPGGPALVVRGRVLVRREGRWDELPAPGRAGARRFAAAVASGPRQVQLALGGTVLSLDGRRWRATEARAHLGAGEAVSALLGLGDGRALVVGEAGGAVVIERGRARPLVPDGRLAAWRPRAAAAGRGRTPALVAGEGVLDGRAAVVVARLEGARAIPVAEVPGLDGGHPPAALVAALVAGPGEALLVATRSGEVRLRDAAGRWTSGRIDDGPPAEAAHEANPPARCGGAR